MHHSKRKEKKGKDDPHHLHLHPRPHYRRRERPKDEKMGRSNFTESKIIDIYQHTN